MTTTPVVSAQDIAANIASVRQRIAGACARAGRSPSEVILVGASKTVAPEVMAMAHHAGLRDFGENFVQEAEAKFGALAGLTPPPVKHMIGHLQTNKVKDALAIFDIVQSVDSVRLAEAISRRAASRTVSIFLEVNVAGEASKSGLLLRDVRDSVARIRDLSGVSIVGLMTVAPESPDLEGVVRPVFRQLRELRDELKLEALSMGMTGDFEIAIEEGATHVRTGRALFGPRPASH